MASNSTVDWCLGETSTYINCGLWPVLQSLCDGCQVWKELPGESIPTSEWGMADGKAIYFPMVPPSVLKVLSVSTCVFRGMKETRDYEYMKHCRLQSFFLGQKEAWFRPLVHWVLQFHISSDGDLDEMFTDFSQMVGKLAQSDGTTTRRNIHFFVTNKANIWQAVRAAVLKRLKSCPCLNRRCDCVWLNENKTRRLFDMFCRCCAWCRTFRLFQRDF